MASLLVGIALVLCGLGPVHTAVAGSEPSEVHYQPGAGLRVESLGLVIGGYLTAEIEKADRKEEQKSSSM